MIFRGHSFIHTATTYIPLAIAPMSEGLPLTHF